MTDRLMLHRAALETATGYVAGIAETDLGLATPCAEWILADLMAHMVGQHVGFAAAVRDGDAPADAYRPVAFTRQGWDDSVAALLAAFSGADPRGTSRDVELSPAPLPNAMIIGAQLLDTAVHTWDIARSLGADFTPPRDITDEVLAIAAGVPDTSKGSGKAFAAALPVNGTPWARVLRLLGRDPCW